MNPKYLYDFLNLNSTNIDFENVMLDKDNHKYLDPFKIARVNTDISILMANVISDFFITLINHLRCSTNEKEAEELMLPFKEPNENRLGMSSFEPKGKGAGTILSQKFYKAIKEYPLLIDGVINNFEDVTLHVDQILNDRTSDICTRVVFKELANYTLQQCEMYGINNLQMSEEKLFWDKDLHYWNKQRFPLPSFNNLDIIFVPKNLISKSVTLSSFSNFLNVGILGFYRENYYDSEIYDENFYYKNRNEKKNPNKEEVKEKLKNKYLTNKLDYNFFYGLPLANQLKIINHYKLKKHQRIILNT